MRKAVLALFFLVASGGSAAAVEISGANRGEFVAAVEAWLAGSDAEGIQELSEIAKSGNRAAQIFLARLEHRDDGASPWRTALSREEAQSIYRAPQEDPRALFQPSWLRVLADKGDELAIALLDARNPDPDPAVIGTLSAMGEPHAADHATRILALHGSDAQRDELLNSPNLLEELRPFLLYLQGDAEPQGDGVAALRHIGGPDILVDPAGEDTMYAAGWLALGWGFGSLEPDNMWWPLVTDWLMTAPATQPIADLCRMTCPEEALECAVALTALSGGYYEVIRHDSPLESIVPQETFRTSPRARMEALRRAAFAMSESFEPLATTEEIGELSRCAAGQVALQRNGH